MIKPSFKLKEFRYKDLTVEELHKKYAKSNHYDIHRGVEFLGTLRKKHGSWRFFPAEKVDIYAYDLECIALLLRRLGRNEFLLPGVNINT